MTRRDGKHTESDDKTGSTGKRPGERKAPWSLHRILYDCDDPREPYLRDFLRILRGNDSNPWREVAELMAGQVAKAMAQERVREKLNQNSRQTARKKLKEIKAISDRLIELTGLNHPLIFSRVIPIGWGRTPSSHYPDSG